MQAVFHCGNKQRGNANGDICQNIPRFFFQEYLNEEKSCENVGKEKESNENGNDMNELVKMITSTQLQKVIKDKICKRF